MCIGGTLRVKSEGSFFISQYVQNPVNEIKCVDIRFITIINQRISTIVIGGIFCGEVC